MTTAWDDPSALVGQLLGDRYRIEGTIAEGGIGRVYRAVQEPLGRPVAVKVTRRDAASGTEGAAFAERWLREASLAGNLRHPNVVTVHDFGRLDDGRCYIVMELLDGRSLQDVLRDGPLSARQTIEVFAQILRGLRHAHRAGMVHRDMKPANVILVPGDDGVVAKVVDFGLVKSFQTDDERGVAPSLSASIAPELTQHGTFLGTPQYVAPEQARGETTDARTDIYAVGVMLYASLTGRLPFDSRGSAALVAAHLHTAVPPMRDRAPQVAVPPELEAIVRKCLEKRPSDRFPDCDAVIDALEGVIVGFETQLAPMGFAPGEPDEGSGATRIDAAASLHRSHVRTGARRLSDVHAPRPPEPTPPPTPIVTPLPPREPPAPPDAPTPPPRPARVGAARRGLPVLAALGAMTLLGSLSGAALWTLTAPTASEAPAVDAPEALDPALEPVFEPAAITRTVWLLVSSEPAGATVLRDGAPLGDTPYAGAMEVPADMRRLALVVRLGADAEQVELDVSGDTSTTHVVFERKARTPSAAKRDAAAPAPRPSGGVIVADGVAFTAAQAAAALRLANESTRSELLALGIAPRQASVILEKRPFADVGAMAATPFIGEKTLERFRDGR